MYTLTLKSNRKKVHHLSMDEFLEFIGKHPLELYDVSESQKPSIEERTKKPSLFKNDPEELSLYKKTLTFAQINDIQLGHKEIRFSNEVGFHLRTLVPAKESHYSESMKPGGYSELQQLLRNINYLGSVVTNADRDKLRGYFNRGLDLLDNEGNVSRNAVVHDLNNDNHGGC